MYEPLIKELKRIRGKNKKERAGKAKNVLLSYFNSRDGKASFEMHVRLSMAKKQDEKACLLCQVCPVWFAKGHDKDSPNFFVNPCWEMSIGCLCPLRQDGCDKCPRKKENNPLC